jgi:hypothetical protein
MAKTSRLMRFLLVPVIAGLGSLAAQATVVIDTTAGAPSPTFNFLGSVQTFTAPTESVLQDWTFFLAERAGGGSVEFSIYNWSVDAPVGPALYTTTLSWNAAGGATGVAGINLALSPGNLYGAVIDLLGYSGLSVLYTDDLYAGGAGQWTLAPPAGPWFEYSYLDHEFIAVFDGGATIPEPASLALLGLGIAGLSLQRKKRATA